MKLTRLCSHAPVAALLPTRVGQIEELMENLGDKDIEGDPFVAGLSPLEESDLLVEVCLDGLPDVDVEKRAGGDNKVRKFKTIEEQNTFVEKVMLQMARKGHDEEDGWELATVTEPGIQIFQRDVAWATLKQFRAREHGVKATPRQAFEMVSSRYFSKRRKASRERERGDNAHDLFELSRYGDDVQIGVRYRRIPFPWPLLDRDYLYNHVCMVRQGAFIGWTHSIR